MGKLFWAFFWVFALISAGLVGWVGAFLTDSPPFQNSYEKMVSHTVEIQIGDGQGSGFLIDNEGHIITNFHVAKNSFEVKDDVPFLPPELLPDGKPGPLRLKHAPDLKIYIKGLSSSIVVAKLVRYDEKADIALLQIPKEYISWLKLTPARWGDSDQVRYGDKVIAVGSPEGLSNTLMTGVISNPKQEFMRQSYFYYLQSDASINHGNSGGPLYNANGEVIGINTAIGADQVGLALSIPSNYAKRFAEYAIKGQDVPHSRMNVSIVSYAQITDDQVAGKIIGFQVKDVDPKGPAGKANIKENDVITNIDGKTFDKVQDFLIYVINHPSNSLLSVEGFRPFPKGQRVYKKFYVITS